MYVYSGHIRTYMCTYISTQFIRLSACVWPNFSQQEPETENKIYGPLRVSILAVLHLREFFIKSAVS